MQPHSPGARARYGQRRTVWIIAITMAAVGTVIALADSGEHARRPRPVRAATGPSPGYIATGAGAIGVGVRRDTRQAVVTIDSGAGIVGVPPSYFGFSTEYWAMPLFEHHMTLFERILNLARVHGNGPLVLRIGGDSTDHALFDVDAGRLPSSVFALTPRWFRLASVLVPNVAGRVILDLNLVTDLPVMAAQWARAAEAELPRGSIAGYEIGNEPDLYNPWYWSSVFSPIERVLDIRLAKSELSPGAYVRTYESYARVLAKFAPGEPLVAPVVAYPNPDLNWIRALLEAPHPGLRMISAHMYPYSACAARISSAYPTIARVLSENATTGMAASLRPAVELAHDAGLPFRLTELNSVTCGGLAGVSNTFATALWAPDALFELLRAGVNGVNVHVRAYAINAAFALNRGGLVVRPLLYGLILFARTLGPNPYLVRLRLKAKRAWHLKAWAVRVQADILHVLLINKGDDARRVDLRLPAAGPATIQRLLAPSASARSGVTLDGQQLGRDERWHGRLADQWIEPGAGGYELTLPASSAALVKVRVRAGALL